MDTNLTPIAFSATKDPKHIGEENVTLRYEIHRDTTGKGLTLQVFKAVGHGDWFGGEVCNPLLHVLIHHIHKVYGLALRR